jgi:alpha/beta superfamily hydrolase
VKSVTTSVLRAQSFISVPGGSCLTTTDTPTKAPALANIIIAHGLTGDRVGPVELLSRLSAELCSITATRVVRFDFRGSGDSPGEFSTTTFDGMASDFIAVACATCPAELPVVCAGISIGGVPAVMAAHNMQASGKRDIAAVVLMSSDLVENVRFAVDAIAAIRAGEFHLPAQFFREREGIHPRQLLAETGVPFLLVHGSADHKLVAAAPWFADRGGRVVQTEGDHLFETPAAREALLDAWVSFLTGEIKSLPGRTESSERG